MAIIKCPECGQDVSTYATTCPHCGYPLKEKLESNEKKQIVEEDDVVVAKMKGGGSFASSIVAFVFVDAIFVFGIIVGSIFSNQPALITFAGFLGLFLEALSIVGLISDIKKVSRLNKRENYLVTYNTKTDLVSFIDYDGNQQRIKVCDIIGIDGPTGFQITYMDNGSKKKTLTGFTCREDVLKAREILNKSKD